MRTKGRIGNMLSLELSPLRIKIDPFIYFRNKSFNVNNLLFLLVKYFVLFHRRRVFVPICENKCTLYLYLIG